MSSSVIASIKPKPNTAGATLAEILVPLSRGPNDNLLILYIGFERFTLSLS